MATDKSEFEKFAERERLSLEMRVLDGRPYYVNSHTDYAAKGFAAGERSFQERAMKVLLEHKKSFRNENVRRLVVEAVLEVLNGD